jgi:hypothetical protein
VSTIVEKKGLTRPDACTYLEKLYGLPPLPWDNWEKPADVGTEIREILNRGETLEILKRRITVILDSLWTEKEYVPLDMYLGLWEQYDRILWHVKTKAWDEERGKSELASLIGVIKASIKGAYEQATADEDTMSGLGGPLDSPTDPH